LFFLSSDGGSQEPRQKVSRIRPHVHQASLEGCGLLKRGPSICGLEIELESHLTDIGDALSLFVGEHVVEHPAKVGVEVPIDTGRDITQLPAPDNSVVEVQ